MDAVPFWMESRNTAEPIQLSFAFAYSTALSLVPPRITREARTPTIRLVEYAPFPRIEAGHIRCQAHTLDMSSSGMCLLAPNRHPIGTLLHVQVYGVFGNTLREALVRIAWSKPTADEKFLLGVEFIAEAPRTILKARSRFTSSLHQVA